MRQAESAPILIRAAAVALLALSVVVITGWAFDVEPLKRVLPGANSMKFNTALGFLFAGLGLWFNASPRTDTLANAVRRWAPVGAAALGAAALFEYATGFNLGFNEAIFVDDSEFNFGAPGRMTVITGIEFILFALALAIPRQRSRRIDAAFLIITTLGFSAAALATIGYLYQLPLLYRPLPASAIAFHTALGLVIAFCGVFATRVDIGWLSLTRGQGVTAVFGRQLLPTVILTPLILGWIALAIEGAGWVDARTALAIFALVNIAVLGVVIGRAGRAMAGLEGKLQRREQVYQAITANALDAFILADDEGRVIDWNPQAEAMFGWRRDEAMGNVVRELIMPPDARAGHAAGLEQFKAEGHYEFFGRRVEVDSVRRDLSRFRAELIAIPIKLGDDLFFALFARDVTDIRLAEEQLRHAQKMEAVGRLTGGIAHDFNNTLTAIIAMLDSVQARVTPELRPRIETALNAADRAAMMIKQLLAFSRKQVLQPSRLDLNAVVERTVDVLRPTLGEQVRISLSLGADLPEALADASQVDSALLNLSINARDAMPEGGKLTIETGLVELDAGYALHNLDVTPGRYLMIAVSDTGAGMSAETLERAFEPFFTTKGVERGSGLGLSMVHGFVKQSGGHVKIYSELGHGTTVRLYLPLAYAADLRETADAEAPHDHAGGGETILLVEDNPLVRVAARASLRDLGYNVLEAADAVEAREIISSGVPIDLLFTDIVMPRVTGIALAEDAALERPDLRVLYTSGYTDHAVTQNNRLAPDAHFLSKPYRTRDLAARVRQALDQPAPPIPTTAARAR